MKPPLLACYASGKSCQNNFLLLIRYTQLALNLTGAFTLCLYIRHIGHVGIFVQGRGGASMSEMVVSQEREIGKIVAWVNVTYDKQNPPHPVQISRANQDIYIWWTACKMRELK